MLSVIKRVSPSKEISERDKKGKKESRYRDRNESPDEDSYYKKERYSDKDSSKHYKSSRKYEDSYKDTMHIEEDRSSYKSAKHKTSSQSRRVEESPPEKKKDGKASRIQREDEGSPPYSHKMSQVRSSSRGKDWDSPRLTKSSHEKRKKNRNRHDYENLDDDQDRRTYLEEGRNDYDRRKDYRSKPKRDYSPENHMRDNNKRALSPYGRDPDMDEESRKKDSNFQKYEKRDLRNERNENDNERQKDFPDNKPEKKTDDVEPLSKKIKIDNVNTKTGGAYIPPARLRMMQEKIKDKGSEAYQRLAWEALKKSIVGMTNKVNASNIAEIVPELFKENIIRGRGVLTRAIMQAQAASPTFTRVYAALVAIINTKFPEIGELLIMRLIIQYRRSFRRNDKTSCMSAVRFLAHLLNQEVAHEVLILEIVTHLFANPTNDSVEIAIATLKECGKKLTELTPKGMRAIAQRVRDVLHQSEVDVRVRYMIEVFFAIQKDGFKDFDIVPQELDLVEEEDKCTHLINLDDAVDNQEMLNIFKFDPEYEDLEEKYKAVVKEILGEGSDEEGSGDESGSGDDEEDEETKAAENQEIIDMTETNIVVLRRKIYLIVQSSLDFEECAHKLLKLELKPGQILEMCYMILDCCAQQRTYEKFFGLLAQRFCQMNKIYVDPFTEIFDNSYKTIHRLETNKLRNVAKFFAHLLYTDAISWMVLASVKLNEEDTTSSSRIFIKILFQELCEYMGLTKLNQRVKDITLQEAFEGLFPRDHPHNTRFAINFFTSIGLGGLTDELREHLKNLPKTPIIPQPAVEVSSSSSSSSSSSNSSSSSSSSSSTSSESESDNEQKKKKSQKRKRK